MQLNKKKERNSVKSWASDLNRHISKEEIQIANKCVQRHSTSLVIGKVQIKAMIKYHFTFTMRAIITIIKENNKWWWEYGEIGILVHFWWECKMVQTLCKIFWQFLIELNIELPYDPIIPFLGVYPKEFKTGVQTKTSTWMFTAALFTMAKRWEQPKCPSTDNG